jgi:hypothetical protein
MSLELEEMEARLSLSTYLQNEEILVNEDVCIL